MRGIKLILCQTVFLRVVLDAESAFRHVGVVREEKGSWRCLNMRSIFKTRMLPQPRAIASCDSTTW